MTEIDLHVHTNFSDGMLSPAGLIERANRIGIRVLAVTDHDTTEGIDPSLEAAKGKAIELVPAVELNSETEEAEVHILGYFIDHHQKSFQQRLEEIRRSRLERIRKILNKLEGLGVHLEESRILEISGRGSVGRPHIGWAMIEKGYAESLQESFEKFIARGAPAYVPRYKFPPEEAIRLILQCGGLPVLAHPGIMNCDQIIPNLVKEGLMGIEVYYSAHTFIDKEKYKQMAQNFGLLITGGSDYHGPGSKNQVELGSVYVPGKVYKSLKEKAGK